MNSKSASIPTLAFRVISKPQSTGRGYASSIFPVLVRVLVNFAHSGTLKVDCHRDERRRIPLIGSGDAGGSFGTGEVFMSFENAEGCPNSWACFGGRRKL